MTAVGKSVDIGRLRGFRCSLPEVSQGALCAELKRRGRAVSGGSYSEWEKGTADLPNGVTADEVWSVLVDMKRSLGADDAEIDFWTKAVAA